MPEDTYKYTRPINGEELGYDLRVYSSPKLLERAIQQRKKEIEQYSASIKKKRGAQTAPLCRMLATYDWGYTAPVEKNSAEGYVTLYNCSGTWIMPDDTNSLPQISKENYFSKPWNYVATGKETKSIWSVDEAAETEIGSYFTIQGFDLNYAGVIIGPSIAYRNGRITVDASKSTDSDLGDHAEELILRQLGVLLRRGIHGLYLFAVDPELQKALEQAARASGKLDIKD